MKILNILNWVVLGFMLLSTSYGQNFPIAQGWSESTISFEFDEKFTSRHSQQQSIDLEILDESKKEVVAKGNLRELGDTWKLFLEEEKSYYVRYKTLFFGEFISPKFSGGEDVTLTVQLPSVTSLFIFPDRREVFHGDKWGIEFYDQSKKKRLLGRNKALYTLDHGVQQHYLLGAQNHGKVVHVKASINGNVYWSKPFKAGNSHRWMFDLIKEAQISVTVNKESVDNAGKTVEIYDEAKKKRLAVIKTDANGVATRDLGKYDGKVKYYARTKYKDGRWYWSKAFRAERSVNLDIRPPKDTKLTITVNKTSMENAGKTIEVYDESKKKRLKVVKTNSEGVAAFDFGFYDKTKKYFARTKYKDGRWYWSGAFHATSSKTLDIRPPRDTRLTITVNKTATENAGKTIEVYDFSKTKRLKVVKTNSEGLAAFDFGFYDKTKKYFARTKYKDGRWYWSGAFHATGAKTLNIVPPRHTQISIKVNKEDVENSGKTIEVYDESKKKRLKVVKTGSNGTASFDFGFRDKEELYYARTKYKDGRWYWSGKFRATSKVTLNIRPPRDTVLSIQVSGENKENAGKTIEIYDESKKKRLKVVKTDSSGKAAFDFGFHDKTKKYYARTKYKDGRWYWSGAFRATAKKTLNIRPPRDTILSIKVNKEAVENAGKTIEIYDESKKKRLKVVKTNSEGVAAFDFGFHDKTKKYYARTKYKDGRWYWSGAFRSTHKKTLNIRPPRDTNVTVLVDTQPAGGKTVEIYDASQKKRLKVVKTDSTGVAGFDHGFHEKDVFYYARYKHNNEWVWSNKLKAERSAKIWAGKRRLGEEDWAKMYTPGQPRQVVIDTNRHGFNLAGKRIYVFDGNRYTGVNGKVGDDGKLALTVPGKALRYRVDYAGQYFIETTHRPEIRIPHRRVVIDSNNGDHNLSGTRVYAFSGNSYSGVSAKFGTDGKATLYLPPKEFRYRVDYAGQHFTDSTKKTKVSVQFREVVVDTNNGDHNLAGVRVYAFNGNSYTGLSQKVGEDGKATFYLPDTEFRYRVDYAGQVYTDTTDSEAINVAYRVVTLDSNNDGFNLAGSRVYVFSGNSYQGLSQKFGEDGLATFYLPEREYRYRVDYAGQNFTDATVDTEIDIAYRSVVVDSNVGDNNLEGSRVYVFNGNSYTGLSTKFDDNGLATFYLPEREYRYRVDYAGQNFTPSTDATEIPIGDFRTVTVDSASGGEALAGKRVYVFNGNSYTGLSRQFDAEGLATFFLPNSEYRFRVDHDGQHFSDATNAEYLVYAHASKSFTEGSPVADIPVTVTQGDRALENLAVRVLYGGTDAGISGTTDSNGQVVLQARPADSTVFQVEFLGNLYEAGIVDGAVNINISGSLTTLDIIVQDIGLSGVQVSVLDADGNPIGLTVLSDVNGAVSLDLPPGANYLLKLTYQGNEYIIDPAVDVAGGTIDFGAVAGEEAPEVSGLTTLDKLIAGIYKAIEIEADVINISLGFDSYEEVPALETALQDAKDAGIVIVAAGGNEANDIPFYPAASPHTIGVGSVDQANMVTYTKTGPWVQIFAPGLGIYTTSNDGGYTFYNGTSFAAPFVSGLAAHLRSFDPDITFDEILAKLNLSEVEVDSSYAAYNGLKVIDFQASLSDYMQVAANDIHVTPQGGGTTINFTPSGQIVSDDTVVFNWPEGVGQDSYEIWLVNSDTGKVALREAGIATSSKAVTNLANGHYVWWVRGYTSSGFTQWSKPNYFTRQIAASSSSGQVSFTWEPDSNAVEYELIVHKVNSVGKILVSRYDDSAAPSLVENPNQSTVTLTGNSYTPDRAYAPGLYDVWVRSKLADNSFSNWKPAYRGFEVTGELTKLSDYGFSWAPVANARQYEVMVHKVNATGRVIKRGYDVAAAPWVSFGAGADALVVHDHYYVPAYSYEPGFYDVWARARLADDSFSSWIAVEKGFEVDGTNLGVSDYGMSWDPIPDAQRYEVLVHKVSENGKVLVRGYDIDAVPFISYGAGEDAMVVTGNRYFPRRDYEPGLYDVWVRAQLSDASFSSFRKVWDKKQIHDTGQTVNDTGFTWAPIENANRYEVLVKKLDDSGNVIDHRYDIEGAPFIEDGLGLKAKVIRTNYYVPSKEYEPGNYRVWMRARLQDMSFTSFVKLHDPYVVGDGSTGGLMNRGYTLNKIDGALHYEVLVHKVDSSGKILVRGYDVSSAPWIDYGMGSDARLLDTNYFQPSVPYHNGYYDIWYRARKADNTVTSWQGLRGREVSGVKLAEHQIGFVWEPVADVKRYEVLVHKVSESGRVLIRGYDTSAAPFVDYGTGANALFIRENRYQPQRKFESGYYDVWVRAQLQDDSLTDFVKVKEGYRVDTSAADLSFSWNPVDNAQSYELMVHKVDSAGKIVVRGYDVNHAPSVPYGLGAQATELSANNYTPDVQYHPGLYNVWMRTRLQDNSQTGWTKIYDKYEVVDQGFNVRDLGFAWEPIPNAQQYEVLVHKVNENGRVLVRGYDLDATPWLDYGVGVQAVSVNRNRYVPAKLYETGFYDVWIRARLADNSLSPWVAAIKGYEVK